MIVFEDPKSPLLQHMDRQDVEVEVAQQAHLPEPPVCPSQLGGDAEGKDDEEDSPIPDTFFDYNGQASTPETSLNLKIRLTALNLPHRFVSGDSFCLDC